MKIFLFFASVFLANLSFAQTPELLIPKGHTGSISVLAISPDKKWLASADNNGAVKLWDMQTAKEVKTFNIYHYGYGVGIKGLTFSPDSKKLYIGDFFNLLIYDLSNAGKEILNKKIHEGIIVTQILFSPNGKIFATATDDEVKIWDADNLASPKVVAIKGKKPKLAFDDASNIIVVTTGNYTHVSSSFDFTDIVTNIGYITHINTATGQVIVTDEFENLKSDETYISPNGKLLAITRYEKLIEDNEEVSVGTVQLLDISSKKIVKKFTGIQDSSINKLSFSTDNRYMVTKAGKSFILYDLATLKFVKTFYGEDIFTDAILFSADNTKLFQGINSDGAVVQWNLTESKVEKVFGSQANFVKNLVVTPNQQSLVMLYGTSEYYGERFFLEKFDLKSTVLSKIKSTGIANTMNNFDIGSAGGGRLFEPDILNRVDAILTNQTVTAFSISNNNKMLVTTNGYESPRPQLSFYNIEEGKKINDIPLQWPVYFLLFTKDDKILYVGYEGNNKIDKIEIETGTILKTFEHVDTYSKDSKIKYMLLSKDESTLIGVNNTRNMYSWNTATGVESKLNVSSDTRGFSIKAVPNTNEFIYGDGLENIETYDLVANKITRAFKWNSAPGALDITPDGKFIFYSNADKSVSIGDLTKGTLVATMVFFGETDWVIVDKAGRFDGTPEGIKKMYYVKGLDIIPLESNYEQFYTPSLLQRILEGENFKPSPVNINNLKDAPKVKIAAEQIKRNLTVEDDVAVFSSEKEQVNIKVQADCPNDGVTEIRLFQNGKLVETTRNLTVEDEKTSEKSSVKTFAVTLSLGENRFKAIAFNTERTESKPAELIVSYTALNIDEPAKTATTLHLIVVGINTYKNPKYNLNYAVADATSFAEAISSGSKDLFTTTNTIFLKDADATKEGMTAALEKIKAVAKPQDLFLFYYAGHGVINDKQQFYLVPYDVTQLYGNDEALAQKGFSSADLQLMSKNIKAQKQLFILDACQSAGALNEMVSSRGVAEEKAIAQLARATGTHWLTASSSQQFASEFSQLGHGSFTYCLLQAFKGEANPGDKKLTVKILDAYLQIKVPEITQKYKGTAQLPVSFNYGNDFPIIMVK